MKLRLHDILDRPGAKKSFSFDLDLRDLSFAQIAAMHGSFPVTGEVCNMAGALTLYGTISVDMACLCDRCTTTIPRRAEIPVTAHLAETLVDEENPDIFLLDGGMVDLEDVFTTAFVLSLDSKNVCREDCRGLCQSCGKNLNAGDCDCRSETDPRFAALQQLLDQ